MKWSLRLCSAFLLIIVGSMTLARRENSGWIAHVSVLDGQRIIVLMTGSGDEIRKLSPENMCATRPRWSPDAAWILFLNPCDNTQDLLRIRPYGKLPQPVTSASTFTTGEVYWSPDSRRLVVPRGTLGIFIVEPDANSERFLALSYDTPQWSGDGRWIYARPTLPADAALVRIDIETGGREGLLPPEVTPSALSWSPGGAFIMFTMPTDHGDELFFMQPDGSDLHSLPIDLPPPQIRQPGWSPDGQWIAFLGGEPSGARHIYRVRVDGRNLERLTEQAGDLLALQWSPDGEWLLFRRIDSTGANIFRMRPDGSSLQNLTPGPGNDYSPEYAPVAGSDWHPLALTLLALGILAASFYRFFALRINFVNQMWVSSGT